MPNDECIYALFSKRPEFILHRVFIFQSSFHTEISKSKNGKIVHIFYSFILKP